MRSPSPDVRPRILRTTAALVVALALSVAGPASATPGAAAWSADSGGPSDQLLASLWAAWLDLWSPVASWVAADTTGGDGGTTGGDGGTTGGDGGTSGGGTGGSGGLGPGSGGGYLDPDG